MTINKTKCSYPGCTHLSRVKGMCINHYQREWQAAKRIEDQQKQREGLRSMRREAQLRRYKTNPYIRWVRATQTAQEGKTELNQYIGIANDILSDCSES